MCMKYKEYIEERRLIPVKNKYAEGKRLGPLEPYNPNNPEHDDPKKYVYYSAGGTVWEHVMRALETSDTKDPIKNLSILLHDIGKGVTLSFKGGLPKYYRHAEEGIKLVKEIAKKLRMSKKEEESLVFSVANHMKMNDILKMRPGKIVNLVNNDNWDVLVAVAKADEFSRGETFMYHGEFEKIIDKCVDIKNRWGIKQVNKINKYVDGNKIMKLLNIPPGPMVGKIKSQVIEWILDNNVKDEERIDDYIRSLL